jgi:hypothetical protein
MSDLERYRKRFPWANPDRTKRPAEPLKAGIKATLLRMRIYPKNISGGEPLRRIEGVLARDMAIGSPVDLGPAGSTGQVTEIYTKAGRLFVEATTARYEIRAFFTNRKTTI